MTAANKYKLPLYLTLLLGLALRLKDLTKESLWFDESHTLILSRLSFTEIIPAIAIDVHPPFYFLLMQVWTNLFGESVFVLRFFSVIFGTFSIYLLYKIAEELYSKKTGIIAALFLSLSSLHIHYSQETRMYALVFFLSLASLYFFIKFLKERKNADLTFYVITSSLMLYTHSTSVFLLVFQNIYFLLDLYSKGKGKEFLLKWLLSQALIILLYLPWIGIIIYQWGKVSSQSWGLWVKTASLERLYQFLNTYAGFGLVYFAIPILALGKKLKKTLFPILLLVTALFIPFLVSKFIKEMFIIRITLPALAGFYLLSSFSIANLKKKYLFLCLPLLCFFLLTDTCNYYQRTKKEEWNKAASFVEKTAIAGDTVLFNAGYIKDFAYGYYAKRKDLNNVAFPEKSSRIKKEDLPRLAKIIEGKNRIYLVRAMSFDSERSLEKLLSSRFKKKTKQEFYQVEVVFFRN